MPQRPAEPHHSPEDAGTGSWTGSWVRDRLELDLHTSAAPLGVRLEELVGLAVRRNPRRAHLLVSLVLGKHVPTDPRLVLGSGLLLGRLVAACLAAPAGAPHPVDPVGGGLLREALRGVPGAGARLLAHSGPNEELADGGVEGGDVVVLGYAETATALGHAVSDALGAPYLHSTRRAVPGVEAIGGFEEEHSHATSHLLLPETPEVFTAGGVVVLVDDELSTGTTALNTIAALHRTRRRSRYVVAALVDLRSEGDRERMAALARELGARIDVVALAAGRVDAPADVLERGVALVREVAASHLALPGTTSADTTAAVVAEGWDPASVARVDLGWPAGLREGGRHGFDDTDRRRMEDALPAMASVLADVLGLGVRRVHVLGFEELMYAPLRLASALETTLAARGGETVEVTFSTTTRSPVLAVPDEGYAIRSALEFGSHDDPDDGAGPRFAYNLLAAEPGDRFDAVVLVVDDAGDTSELVSEAGLVGQLARLFARVLLVTVPAHVPLPSYRPGKAL